MIFITANNLKNNFAINKKYCDAVSKFGQKPILISDYDLNLIDKIILIADGIIFSGGGDIHPSFFKQKFDLKTNNINLERDKFEILLCQKAIKKNLSVLAICRGCQILNIALGGDLIQHVDNHIQNIPCDMPSHYINIKKNTKLFNMLGQKFLLVNSFHHQVINKLGQNLISSAIAFDKTQSFNQSSEKLFRSKYNLTYIEAIEHVNKKFVIGLQWHPEALNKIYLAHDKIFYYFIKSTLV